MINALFLKEALIELEVENDLVKLNVKPGRLINMTTWWTDKLSRSFCQVYDDIKEALNMSLRHYLFAKDGAPLSDCLAKVFFSMLCSSDFNANFAICSFYSFILMCCFVDWNVYQCFKVISLLMTLYYYRHEEALDYFLNRRSLCLASLTGMHIKLLDKR